MLTDPLALLTVYNYERETNSAVMKASSVKNIGEEQAENTVKTSQCDGVGWPCANPSDTRSSIIQCHISTQVIVCKLLSC